MKIKNILFLTILLTMIALLPYTANAAVGETFINDGVEYKVLTEVGNTGTVQITDYDNNKAQLTIPEIITYDTKQYTVVDIGYSAFSGCDTLTNIKLPNSITGIGDNAFSRCTSLTSIIIPDSVKAIPYNCFSGSTSLEYVKLPESLECIRQSSFNDCIFKSLVIPNTVESIEYNAFGGCNLLEKIVIPNSVVWIGYNAFGGANSLTIYGETGSYVEGYANNEHRTFVAVNTSIYKIINDLKNITSDGVSFVESGVQNYKATLKAGFASTLPNNITIQMEDSILIPDTDYSYDDITGEIKITKAITGDIKITAQAVNTKKSVNNVLTNIQSSGLDEIYPAEENYVANLVADSNYKLPEAITVKVGDTTLDNNQYKYDNKTGTLIIYAKNITDDVTIEAIAIEIKYKVIFDANGGNFTEARNTLIYEDWKYTDEENLEEPTRKGYNFIGYYTEDGDSFKHIMTETGIDDDMIFYAKWEEKELEQIEVFEHSENQEFVIGKDKRFVFELDNNRGEGKVLVDGKELNEKDGYYTWHFVEGIYPSITLSEEYVNKLKLGKHIIKFIVDEEFYAETTFTIIEDKNVEDEKQENIENEIEDEIQDSNLNINVEDSLEEEKLDNSLEKEENKFDNPKTGDSILLFVGLFALSAIGIFVTTKLKKNYKNK